MLQFGRGGSMSWVSKALLPSLLFLVAGCSGSDSPSDPGNGAPPTPSFTLAVSPASVSVDQGAQGQFTVTLTRSGGFGGAVNLAVEGLPTGVTAGSNLSVGASATSLTVTLTAAEDAAVGMASLTVRGTAGDLAAQTASIALTVNEVSAPVPDFEITLDPNTLTLEAGGSAEVAVSISRTGGFDGVVTFSAGGLPDGVSAVFEPEETTGTGSSLILAAEPDAEPTSVSVAVIGSADELGSREAGLVVEVTTSSPPPPPGTGNVTWLFCAEDAGPLWVAVRDGDGPWVRIQGEDDRYTFQVDGDRGGVAWVTDLGGSGFSGTDLEVFLASREELQGFGLARCDGEEGPGFAVSGSVAGVDPTQQVSVTLGPAFAQVIPVLGSSFTLERVQPGTHDLVASLTSFEIEDDTPIFQVDRLILRRGLTPNPGSTLAPLDFNGNEAFAPVTVDVTLENLGTDRGIANSSFVTANGTVGLILSGGQPASAAAHTVYTVPQDRTVAGDLQLLTAFAFPGDPEAVEVSRGVLAYEAPAAAVSLSLGPTPTLPQVEAVDGGSGRIRASYAIQPEYDRYWTAAFSQSSGGAFRSVNLQMSRGYQGTGASEAQLVVPDFSTVAGWNDAWGLQAGIVSDWTFVATGWEQAGGVTGVPFLEGSRMRFGTRTGEVTP